MASIALENPGFNAFVLESETVADAIVQQIISRKSGQVIIPKRMVLLPLLRGSPAWVQEAVMSGIAHVFPEEATEGGKSDTGSS